GLRTLVEPGHRPREAPPHASEQLERNLHTPAKRSVVGLPTIPASLEPVPRVSRRCTIGAGACAGPPDNAGCQMFLSLGRESLPMHAARPPTPARSAAHPAGSSS